MVLSQPGGEAQGAAGSSPDAGGESRAGALPFLLSMFAFGVAASSQAAEAAGMSGVSVGCSFRGVCGVQPCCSRQEGGQEPGRPC